MQQRLAREERREDECRQSSVSGSRSEGKKWRYSPHSFAIYCGASEVAGDANGIASLRSSQHTSGKEQATKEPRAAGLLSCSQGVFTFRRMLSMGRPRLCCTGGRLSHSRSFTSRGV